MKTIQQFLLRPWLYLGIVIIGIALKFYSIESKYFWYDEIETIMHTSGISDNDYYALVPINEVKNISFYHNLLHLNTQNYTIGSQLKGLFSMPQLTPLHPALLIFWHRIVGDGYIHYRLFNVFIFLLTLPFLFLLCKTLFKSNLSGWIAISLFAISPFYNIWTQEARYIMLWAFFVVVINYIFLQAINHNNLKWWIGYSVIAVLIMYSSLLSATVLFGHLLYVWIIRKDLRLVYSFIVLIVFLIYLPWILIMLKNQDEILRSMNWQITFGEGKVNIWTPFAGQLVGFASLFTTMSSWSFIRLCTSGEITPDIFIQVLYVILISTLLIYSIIFLFKKSLKQTLFFLILITIPPVLFIFIIDIVRNGWVSFIWRYQVVSFSGIILIVINYIQENIRQKKLVFAGIFLILSISGILSIFTMPKNQYSVMANYKIGEIISKTDNTLIITDFKYFGGIGGFLEVMAKCNTDNINILYSSPDNTKIKEQVYSKDYSNVFVIHASKELIQNIKSQFGENVNSLDYGGGVMMTPMWQIKN